MNNFIITTDTTSDLPEQFCLENDIKMLFISFTLDDINYCGGKEKISATDFYAKMREGKLPQTAQITPLQATEVFEEYLKQGIDVLHLSFSSGLSGSYNSTKIAAEELKQKYPDRKVIIVDTLAASLGEGLLVYKANKLKNEGKSIQEVAEWVEKNKLHLCHMFTVDDLMHLHRGGRVSKATAIIGSALGIKPVLHVDNAGKLISLSKVRGRKQSLTWLVDKMQEKAKGFENDIVFISHGDCEEDALIVKDLVEKRLGVKSFLINHIGPAIGTHSGPGTVALFFMGNQR